MSGVSIGAINAALMGLYGADETKKMTTDMVDLWHDLKNEQILKPWPTQSLFNLSKYDGSSVTKFMKEKIDQRLDPSKGL